MEVHILSFGITREIIGTSDFAFHVKEESTVLNLKNILIQKYPTLKTLNSLNIAVNGHYQNDHFMLSPNDEIALIPPVSGG